MWLVKLWPTSKQTFYRYKWNTFFFGKWCVNRLDHLYFYESCKWKVKNHSKNNTFSFKFRNSCSSDTLSGINEMIEVFFCFLLYRNFTWISFCYLLTPIFRGKFRTFFTNNSAPKKIQWTTNCPKNLHVKNEVVLWPQTSSKIIVLVAQPIFTDGGPPLRKGLELL